ncbi:MAG: hypothetical protein ACK414_14260 [Gemmobacter sp.]
MIRAFGPFLSATLAALAGVWAFWALVGGATFAVGPTRLPMVYALAPLLALALFQLVFSGLTGRWRGWRFWAAAGPVAASLWTLGVAAALTGYAAPAVALAGATAVTLAFGLFALAATGGRR